MFEKASREKTRFQYKGQLSVEDLWDLDVKELDSIFKSLNAKLRITKEESLLDSKSEADKDLEFQVSIVKHVVEVKLKEAEDRKQSRERREKKQKLMELLAKKQDANLEQMSEDDLLKKIQELSE